MAGKAQAGSAQQAIEAAARVAQQAIDAAARVAPPFEPDMVVLLRRHERQGSCKWQPTDAMLTYRPETVGTCIDTDELSRGVGVLMQGVDDTHGTLGPYFSIPTVIGSPAKMMCEAITELCGYKVVNQEFRYAVIRASNGLQYLTQLALDDHDYRAFHDVLVCLYDSMDIIFSAFRLNERSPHQADRDCLSPDLKATILEVDLFHKIAARSMRNALGSGYVCEDFYTYPHEEHASSVFSSALYVFETPVYAGLVSVLARLRQRNHALFMEYSVPPVFKVGSLDDSSSPAKLKEFVNGILRMFRAEDCGALALSMHERCLIFRWLSRFVILVIKGAEMHHFKVFRQAADGMLNLFVVHPDARRVVYRDPSLASDSVVTCSECEKDQMCWNAECVASRTKDRDADDLYDDDVCIFRLVSVCLLLIALLVWCARTSECLLAIDCLACLVRADPRQLVRSLAKPTMSGRSSRWRRGRSMRLADSRSPTSTPRRSRSSR